MTTDSPTGGETLEERPAWDGTAGTAVAYIRTLEADRARLRAEVGHLRAAITTPEVYYGVIAEEVADAYEKQGAELRQARAEVARLTAQRNRAQGRANENAEAAREYVARAAAAEARAAEWEKAARDAVAAIEAEVTAHYTSGRGGSFAERALEDVIATCVIQLNRFHALNPEGGEDGR